MRSHCSKYVHDNIKLCAMSDSYMCQCICMQYYVHYVQVQSISYIQLFPSSNYWQLDHTFYWSKHFTWITCLCYQLSLLFTVYTQWLHVVWHSEHKRQMFSANCTVVWQKKNQFSIMSTRVLILFLPATWHQAESSCMRMIVLKIWKTVLQDWNICSYVPPCSRPSSKILRWRNYAKLHFYATCFALPCRFYCRIVIGPKFWR